MESLLLGIQHLFPTILRMSLSASVLVLVVIVLRFIFRKTPKWMFCLLWLLVAVRLLCPILPESRVSLMPKERVQEAQLQSALDAGLPTVEFETIQDHAINQARPEDHNVSVSTSATPSEYLPFVWAIGVLLMLLYALISFLRLKRRAAVTMQVSEGVLSCDEVQSPFILGIIRPKIYLPSGLAEPQLSYVLAHERAHLRRRDHWWKPLGYLLLAVHWFNPLCWVAYILLCRDIEMACDERVIRDMDREQIAAYSQTILDCGLPRKRIAACPLAFGEVGVKTRVKGVLNYKKPAFWIVLVTVIVCIALAVCLLTDPFSNRSMSGKLGISMDMAVAEHHRSAHTEDTFTVLDYDVLRVSKQGNETTVYAWILYEQYSFDGSDVKVETGSHVPTAITFDTSSGDTSSYDVIEYWEPRDGSYYAEDIRAKFPLAIQAKAFDVSGADRQHERNLQAAREYFGVGQAVAENEVTRKFYLTIGAEGVTSIEVTTPNTSGGCQNADGSLFRKGEQVWLETLDGYQDLRGVTLTALDVNGETVWTASIPDTDDNKGFTRLTQDGWTISDLPDSEATSTRRLTLEDVHALASRGEALTWEDLRPFEGEDVGSGLYIYRYPIDGTYCLEARGGSLEGAPMSVLLLHVDEAGGFRPSTGYSIDIRTDDIDVFLAAQANKEPFLTVTSGGQSVAAYPIMLYERTWTEHGWLYADGVPAASEVLEHPERIPTLTLGNDFSVAFGGGAVRKSGLGVYDEQFSPLRESWYGDTALNWLDPGTYYCVIEVHGPLGNYIASEDAYEESAYRCIFRLTVSAKGTAAYTPQEVHDLTRATLRYRGVDYVLTDADSLRQLEAWLSGAAELVGGAGCPFGSLLTLTRSDGSEVSLCPAEDSCGTVFAGGHYYRYGSGNEAFWALFGVSLN